MTSITLPPDIVSPHDETWDEVRDYLIQADFISEDENIVKLELELSPEELVTITNLETVIAA